MSPPPKAIVQYIWDARRDKTPEPEIAEHLSKLGLSPEHAAHVLEMVEFSLNRAFMETLGGLHLADYDGDPFFKASLKLARRRFPPSPDVLRRQRVIRAAAGAAIAVGMFAIGAVIYCVIDFWRAPR